jgi:hypothetical protein
MRLAPKPAQGNANAVTSDPHMQSEDAGSEVAVVDYDSEFAAKHGVRCKAVSVRRNLHLCQPEDAPPAE